MLKEFINSKISEIYVINHFINYLDVIKEKPGSILYFALDLRLTKRKSDKLT